MKCVVCKKRMKLKAEIRKEQNDNYYCTEYFYCEKCGVTIEKNEINIGQEIIIR